MLQESVWKTRELIGARINVGGRVWGGLALHRAAKFACQHKGRVGNSIRLFLLARVLVSATLKLTWRYTASAVWKLLTPWLSKQLGNSLLLKGFSF